ncbi:MAG TPA: hypothetical protein VGF91_08530 [Solirubrobacteraceae bacterium]|jgi:hypothetical protein
MIRAAGRPEAGHDCTLPRLAANVSIGTSHAPIDTFAAVEAANVTLDRQATPSATLTAMRGPRHRDRGGVRVQRTV